MGARFIYFRYNAKYVYLDVMGMVFLKEMYLSMGNKTFVKRTNKKAGKFTQRFDKLPTLQNVYIFAFLTFLAYSIE